ncbi:hypothetical protein RCC89_18475 [Cytophagaceae bacterium ABcell3]|nr:hypothetical protein RCC89_18475 [Cytophagaceae bacterium ABcell3]
MANLYPYSFYEEVYYIINDSMVFYTYLSGKQEIDLDDFISKETLDTTSITVNSGRMYFYNKKCFQRYERIGILQRKNWKSGVNSLEDTPKGCNDISTEFLDVYVSELEEYVDGVNDYLKPVKTSFFSPYEVVPENNQSSDSLERNSED